MKSLKWFPAFEDILHGSEYLDACREGRIAPDDVIVIFSIDSAQLYHDKDSDCWFSIWVILDLSPDLRYKKQYVLPALFFRHVSALQKEGLTVYDGHQEKKIISHPFFGFGTVDTVALPNLSGMVGHHGNNGCQQGCGMPGRHPPGKTMYYPTALKPDNYTIEKCSHPDIDVRTLELPDSTRYQMDLRKVLISPNNARYNHNWRSTGIVQPSICLVFQENLMVPVPQCFMLNLMHLVSLNIPPHLVSIWHNSLEMKITYEKSPKPEFVVLDDGEIWQEHGKHVTDTHHYFPDSFGWLPRDIS